MGFFDKLNDDIKDAGRIANLRLRLYTLQKNSSRLFTGIGAEVLKASSAPWDNPLSRPEVLGLLAEAHRLEAEKKLLLDALLGDIDKAKDGVSRLLKNAHLLCCLRRLASGRF